MTLGEDDLRREKDAIRLEEIRIKKEADAKKIQEAARIAQEKRAAYEAEQAKKAREAPPKVVQASPPAPAEQPPPQPFVAQRKRNADPDRMPRNRPVQFLDQADSNSFLKF